MQGMSTNMIMSSCVWMNFTIFILAIVSSINFSNLLHTSCTSRELQRISNE